MNIIKLTKVRLIIGVVVLLTLIIASNYLNFRVNDSVSNVIEYKNTVNNDGITFEEFNKLKKQYSDIDLTCYSEVKTKVTNKYDVSPSRYNNFADKKIKTKMILTDENYFRLYPFQIITGGKLDFLSVNNNDKVVVISDVLANALFKSNNVIGSTLKINNDKYRIVGVYKENNSFLYSMSDDGYEKVYIPYTAYRSQDISKLFLNVLTARQNPKHDKKDINSKLTKVLGDKLSEYNLVDYSMLKGILFQNVKILYFVIGLFVIACLIKIMIMFIKEAKTFFVDKMKSDYLKDVLINNKIKISIYLGKVLICIVLIVFVFNLIKFNVVIDKKYLPSENIFDIEFYKEVIVSNIQLNNANENGFRNIYDRYLTTINHVESFILVAELILIINILINYKFFRILKNKFKN
ncbi:putative ABC transport system permease protein [Clostridium acetobutylicum]|uniref:Predicted membrane protein n=1 Tax=Clostridium acetobutylicum (strain ATCC 824 / DSM 792 / JCM 1419 / IAM 19013 / LMG 5710 / NBRC 13948 / NRRL B-527 / VKM B-1787 / 2291 / W) TaxID=272562 RepID=Q97L94_CLOAB|nr:MULTISPECIES: ABC transporter permease [Clostridium]AAK78645.1 Predicted membrane protein [Clostridium acetobutylicum ATCC 824]AEI31369.1 hypothetical protein SMB_G0682 [Clostridium acetobutylicum DSM 1731]AWV80366.1 hypothetical protein DK921_09720 [Clostridium acetobutylicum]MBC2392554.1 ABC transporter permease [Clostridium acetobutylicum]MBC2583848.1 ABC transporter permease [Clostridium acetobutylicum]